VQGTGVEDKRTMLFYHMARHDGLEKLEMSPLFLIQHFQDRLDFLYYRKVEYEPRGQSKEEGPKRNVLVMNERYKYIYNLHLPPWASGKQSGVAIPLNILLISL